MTRWLRFSLRFLAALIALVLLLWLGIIWYVGAHKQQILKEITSRLSDKTGGTLLIKDMKPSLWKSFPDISIALEDISLRDSLYDQHHHSLLEARTLYVRVNTWELISGKTHIEKLTASHGRIFLFTDTNGYSNNYLLSRKDTTRRKKETLFDAFALEDIRLHFEHRIKQKLFDILIRDLDGQTQEVGDSLTVHINTSAHVNQFCFNTGRGSYLRNKDLQLGVRLFYNRQSKSLTIPDQEVRIDDEPVVFGAQFRFDAKPADFRISLRSKAIPYKKAVSWVSQNISRKLDSFDFKKPVAVDVQVSGQTKYRSIPLIRVAYQITDNTLITQMGNIEDVSFKGYYFNEAFPGRGHGDNNSLLQFQQVKGSWNNIPFTMDTLRITNLIQPYIAVRVRSSFPLTTMNGLIGGEAFTFDRGNATADLRYVGGILATDTTGYTINGFVKIDGGGMTYLPRSLAFNDVRSTVLFKDDNVYLRDVHLASKSSSVTMEGEAQHFLRFYFTDPGKILVNWRLRSPLINLNDFRSFIGQRRKSEAIARVRRGPTTRVGQQIDNVLNACSIHLDATVNKLMYRNFSADKVMARLALSQSGINIEQAGLQHAGGNLVINGVIDQTAANNPFDVTAVMTKVNVAAVFKSFDDFGQQAISNTNIAGKLTARAAVKGKMTEGGKILPGSMTGTVDFNLEDGELNNFSPLEKVGRFIFKKRNLSHVTLKSMHNKLLIEGNKITIPPMRIETSAVNIDVEGVYGLQKGTDIFMSIPLRNPEKEDASSLIGKLLRKGKGFVVNLRAQDGDSNGVKIGWDPFKKGKHSLEAADSTFSSD